MFWLIFGRKEVRKLKEDTKKAFDSVKDDLSNVDKWIRHFHTEKESQKSELKELRDVVFSLKEDVEELRHLSVLSNHIRNKRVFKTPIPMFDKQTDVYAVQTGVQTGVQTLNLGQFSVTERAIIWTLLNTDMKLSHEDIAAILGKEKATIRGQINTIKQKSGGILEESIEGNGKKRVFIPEKIKEILLKKTKVRIKNTKKDNKNI